MYGLHARPKQSAHQEKDKKYVLVETDVSVKSNT